MNSTRSGGQPPAIQPNTIPITKSKFLIALTGSIASYKTCYLISELVKAGHEVQVLATSTALKFVGEATLEGLSRRVVLNDNFTRGHMMDHISLARWADVFIIAPLSANHLSLFATGAASDLLSTLFLAYERHKPLFLAPAMNATMYNHPATQANLQLLKNWGANIIWPSSGLLACGEDGLGKMAEPDQILDIVFQSEFLHANQSKPAGKSTADSISNKNTRKKLLIAYGATQEPIDSVRFITNLSTGKTGSQLTDDLIQLGHDVSVLIGAQALKPLSTKNYTTFSSHQDLHEKLSLELKNNYYDAVIHLAAVSDFSVDSICISGDKFLPSLENVKLSSESNITLNLKKNIKIVNTLKPISKNKNIKVIAFKLTNTKDFETRHSAAIKLLNSENIDCVIHNDLNTIDIKNDIHPFLVFRHCVKPSPLTSVQELALTIDTLLKSNFSQNREVTHDSLS